MIATANQRLTEAWLRPVEQIVLPALESKLRVLGFASPTPGAGVTTLCQAAAETLKRSGTKVLLIDLSQKLVQSAPAKVWSPGEDSAADFVAKSPAGYDVLPGIVTPDTRFLFNNTKRLRRALTEELASYDAIIVDLPPLVQPHADGVNPIAAALVCDQVLVVCAHDQTSRSASRSATELARAAGVKLAGVVWNNFGTPPVGLDMARSVRRSLWFAPGIAAFLERRLIGSTFLNS